MENEKEIEFLDRAFDVFRTNGIRSVNMDDLARELSMSKKTIYKYVKDKNELVEKTFLRFQACDIERMSEINELAANAIEELYLISRSVNEHVSHLHPSIFFDLRKYHPNCYAMQEEFKKNFIFEQIKKNLDRGLKEGVYRESLNTEVIAKVYVQSIDAMMSNQLFDLSSIPFVQLFNEVFEYHMHGIANERGRKLYHQLVSNNQLNKHE